MTEDEGERLIIENEGTLCARIYRRFDGTVLTRDCPVGLRAVRKRILWCAGRAAAALAFIIGSVVHALMQPDSFNGDNRGNLQSFSFSAQFPWDPPSALHQVVFNNLKRWLSSAPQQVQTVWEAGSIAMPPSVQVQGSFDVDSAKPIFPPEVNSPANGTSAP